MKYNRFLPLIIPLVVLLFFEIFFFRPNLIYLVIVFILLLFFFISRQFIIASKRNERWWNYFILPAYFSTSLLVFTLLLSNKIMVQVLFALNIIILYLYFISIYNYLIKVKHYKHNSLENVSAYSNFLAFFFISSSVYGLQSFLNISVGPLMVGMILLTGLISYQVVWVNKVNIKNGLLYIILVCLVLVEISWSLSFLPLSFYVLGLVLAISYYMIMGVTRIYIQNQIDKRNIKLYLIFGFFSIFTLLFTAKWM
ncbi:hypothetical protein ACFLZ9_01690 [Patescibacteria group bacterium]